MVVSRKMAVRQFMGILREPLPPMPPEPGERPDTRGLLGPSLARDYVLGDTEN